MPKVNQEYWEKKKNAILDSALSVCNRKVIYDITMKDISQECKISIGGIYKFYNDIDELLTSLLNRSYKQIAENNKFCHARIKDIFNVNKDPKEQIEKICEFVGDYIVESTNVYGKMIFEFTTTLTINGGRLENIQKHLNIRSATQSFIKQVYRFVEYHVNKGNFKPAIEIKEFYYTVFSVYNQVIRQTNLQSHYNILEYGEVIDPKDQMKKLSKTIFCLLGI